MAAGSRSLSKARNMGYQPPPFEPRVDVPGNCESCGAPGEPRADRCPYCCRPYVVVTKESLRPPKTPVGIRPGPSAVEAFRRIGRAMKDAMIDLGPCGEL